MTLSVALVGCGHMGRLHARVVQAHPACRLVTVTDLVADRAQAVAEASGARVVDAVPEDVDIVVVATTTDSHVDLAEPVCRRGQWCFVEKPLALSLAQAQRLVGQRVVVGHSERFHPALHREGPPTLHHRWVAKRLAPSMARGRDVDVVLDLMLHDLDQMLVWTAGRELELTSTWGAHAEDGVLDEAHAVFHAHAPDRAPLRIELQASRRSPVRHRSWSFEAAGDRRMVDLLAPVTGDDALTRQWADVVAAVRGEQPPTVGLHAGFGALGLAEQVVSHLRTGRSVCA